jgi:hypothetical protein
MKKILQRIDKALIRDDRILFFLVVVGFSTFFFSYRYFVTQDGPAHLYNAQLISEFFWGASDSVQSYYELNQTPVPNWTGHLLLAFLNQFLSVELVEKIFLMIYFIGFMYAFRYLAKSFHPQAGFASLIILPFTLNLFVFAGFYNFCIAFIFLFFAVGYFIRNQQRIGIKQGFIILILLILTYFSHVSISVLSLVFIFLIYFWNSWVIQRISFLQGLIQSIPIALTTMPVFLLIIIYAVQHGEASHVSYLSTSELWTMIIHMKPLVGHGSAEHVHTHIYLGLMIVLFLVSVFHAFRSGFKSFKVSSADVLWVLIILLSIVYFILPDSDGKGGYISVRILYVVFLLFFLRVLVSHLPKAMIIVGVILVSINFYFQNEIKKPGQAMLSEWVMRIERAGENIQPDRVVLPVNCSSHWQSSHLSNYLGVKKSLIILDNYEANHLYFPLKWKSETPIQPLASSHPNSVCNSHMKVSENIPDYIFFYGFFDIKLPCEDEMQTKLESGYEFISGDNFYSLYGLR